MKIKKENIIFCDEEKLRARTRDIVANSETNPGLMMQEDIEKNFWLKYLASLIIIPLITISIMIYVTYHYGMTTAEEMMSKARDVVFKLICFIFICILFPATMNSNFGDLIKRPFLKREYNRQMPFYLKSLEEMDLYNFYKKWIRQYPIEKDFDIIRNILYIQNSINQCTNILEMQFTYNDNDKGRLTILYADDEGNVMKSDLTTAKYKYNININEPEVRIERDGVMVMLPYEKKRS